MVRLYFGIALTRRTAMNHFGTKTVAEIPTDPVFEQLGLDAILYDAPFAPHGDTRYEKLIIGKRLPLSGRCDLLSVLEEDIERTVAEVKAALPSLGINKKPGYYIHTP